MKQTTTAQLLTLITRLNALCATDYRLDQAFSGYRLTSASGDVDIFDSGLTTKKELALQLKAYIAGFNAATKVK